MAILPESCSSGPSQLLIFDFCKMGNIEGVQRLLARGDATVRDASPKGWTPLHVSRDLPEISNLAQFRTFWPGKIAVL